MWTRFMDMHSGGGSKEGDLAYIYIEAPKEEAVVIFYNRFGHNPNRVSCTCCGSDYSVSQYETLEEAQKGDKLYSDEKNLVITSADIKESERQGDVPDEGYMWVD